MIPAGSMWGIPIRQKKWCQGRGLRQTSSAQLTREVGGVTRSIQVALVDRASPVGRNRQSICCMAAILVQLAGRAIKTMKSGQRFSLQSRAEKTAQMAPFGISPRGGFSTDIWVRQ